MPKAYRKSKKIAKSDSLKKTNIRLKDKIGEEQVRKAYLYDYKLNADNLFKSAKDGRRKHDQEWLARDLYKRGYQFNRSSSQTININTRGQVKIPINLVWSQMRVIRNQVVNFRPKYEILPRGTDILAQANARYSGRLLDYYYDHLRFRKKIKDTVTQGLTFSVGGPWQIGYDPEIEDIYVYHLDTYDFFQDTYAVNTADAQHCHKAIKRPLDEIRSNPNYEFIEEITTGDNRLAESEYKEFLLRVTKQHSAIKEAEEEGAILRESWIKVYITEVNKDRLRKELEENEQDADDLRVGEVLMRVVTHLDFLTMPLRVQLLRRSDFPFVYYEADNNPLEQYGESWIKHIIPPNRVLNALESSVFDYHYKFAKGRIIHDNNSGVNIITNDHGQIIRKNRGAEVSFPPIPSLPSSYDVQTSNMRRYLEDIGGAHDVSLGRIPTGIKSGVGIAELKSADSTNQQDLVDSLEDFLVEVGYKMLREISENVKVPRIIEALGKSGKPDHFAIIGDDYSKRRQKRESIKVGADIVPLASIGKDNKIRVTIGSWLAYTKTAQQEKLKEYYQAGLIDQQTFLENAEFSDIDNIIDRTRRERMLEKLRGQPSQAGMPSDEEIADQENNMIVYQGKPANPQGVWPEPQDDDQVHLAVHQEYADHPEVSKHMAAHEEQARQKLQKNVTMVAGPLTKQSPQMASQLVSQPQVAQPQAMPTAQAMPPDAMIPGANPLEVGANPLS